MKHATRHGEAGSFAVNLCGTRMLCTLYPSVAGRSEIHIVSARLHPSRSNSARRLETCTCKQPLALHHIWHHQFDTLSRSACILASSCSFGVRSLCSCQVSSLHASGSTHCRNRSNCPGINSRASARVISTQKPSPTLTVIMDVDGMLAFMNIPWPISIRALACDCQHRSNYE